MQTILHSLDYRSLHPVFNDLERFYALTSEKTLHGQSALITPTFDNAFETLQSLFNQYGDNEYNFTFQTIEYKKLENIKPNKNTVIVLFSGGKDSTATAVKYKKYGYNVLLFHVKNINKAYPDEWKRADEIARYLDLPIQYAEFSSVGKLPFIEHPMKNMIIANMALAWSIEHNYGINIVAGNYVSGDLNDSSFYINGDDMPEMWQAYDKIVRKAIVGYTTLLGLYDSQETMEILSEDMKLLNLCQSCLGAHRFRKCNHDNNEKKYDIKLLDNRCGSCWKCCSEYIYLADHDKLEYNEAYYIHCLDVLKRADYRENGVKFTDIESLWYGYLFYDIKDSKYKDIQSYGRHKKKCSQLYYKN